jgi:hypothetical protein
VELKAFVTSLLILAGLAAPQQCVAQATNRTAHQKNLCTVQGEEIEVFDSYLKEGIASPQVLVTKTVSPHFVDVDTLNLQLAAQGRGIPPDVRIDFKEKNKSSCLIKPYTGIPNLHFVSKREHDLMFRNASTGWSDFHEKYGKEAEILLLSRVGFNREKTLALLHVSSAMGGMAGGGTLYLFERKEGKWIMKLHIQTWAT